MIDKIESLKKDLRYQLTFENIDWDYFNETIERAIKADSAWQTILKENS